MAMGMDMVLYKEARAFLQTGMGDYYKPPPDINIPPWVHARGFLELDKAWRLVVQTTHMTNACVMAGAVGVSEPFVSAEYERIWARTDQAREAFFRLITSGVPVTTLSDWVSKTTSSSIRASMSMIPCRHACTDTDLRIISCCVANAPRFLATASPDPDDAHAEATTSILEWVQSGKVEGARELIARVMQLSRAASGGTFTPYIQDMIEKDDAEMRAIPECAWARRSRFVLKRLEDCLADARAAGKEDPEIKWSIEDDAAWRDARVQLHNVPGKRNLSSHVVAMRQAVESVAWCASRMVIQLYPAAVQAIGIRVTAMIRAMDPLVVHSFVRQGVCEAFPGVTMHARASWAPGPVPPVGPGRECCTTDLPVTRAWLASAAAERSSRGIPPLPKNALLIAMVDTVCGMSETPVPEILFMHKGSILDMRALVSEQAYKLELGTAFVDSVLYKTGNQPFAGVDLPVIKEMIRTSRNRGELRDRIMRELVAPEDQGQPCTTIPGALQGLMGQSLQHAEGLIERGDRKVVPVMLRPLLRGLLCTTARAGDQKLAFTWSGLPLECSQVIIESVVPEIHAIAAATMDVFGNEIVDILESWCGDIPAPQPTFPVIHYPHGKGGRRSVEGPVPTFDVDAMLA